FARGRAEQEALRTLGMTRRERVCVALPRALTVAVGGALVGVLGAVTASPLFPIGVARRAEPSPGVDVDWTVVALGFVAIVAVVLAIAWIATFRNVELATSQHRAGVRHRAAVYEVA